MKNHVFDGVAWRGEIRALHFSFLFNPRLKYLRLGLGMMQGVLRTDSTQRRPSKYVKLH